MIKICLYFSLIVLATSCGQQSEVIGPHQRVEYADDLMTLTTVTNQSLYGLCDPGAEIVISSNGIVGSELSLTCSPLGEFAVDVVLTSSDGDKVIAITQTAKGTGAITTDSLTVNLDQNPPNLVADVTPVAAYGVSPIVNNVLLNDVDEGRGIDQASLKILSSGLGGGCSIVFGAVPVVAFEPEQGFSGTSQCVYEVADLLGSTSSTTVTFVIGPNSPIDANNNIVGGTQNILVSVDVLADDTDPNGRADIDVSTLRVTTATDSTNEGTCVVGPAPGFLTFTPNTNYFGTAVCGYEICDYAGSCDSANLSVIIPDVTSPVANMDTATILSGGTPASVDVAANDSDPANNIDPSSVQVLSVNGGSCSLSPTAPNVQFVPASGFVGLGNCSYRICDTQSNCTTGVFEVTVNDGQAPNANNDLASTTSNIPTNPINVSLNDLDSENLLDLSSVSIVPLSDVNGVCSVSPASPLVIFTPALNTVGSGGCDYQICDTSSNCSTASILVTIKDVTAPLAVDDSTSTNQNTPAAAFDVSSNDSDQEAALDSGSVTLTGVESGGGCSLSPASPMIEFTPELDFAGVGSCGYRICDNSGNCSQASLFISVNDVSAPTVTINQLTPGQADPTNTAPITFQFVFSEAIDPASFTSSDLDKSGTTASGGVYSIVNTGDDQNFLLQVSALGSEGLVQISLPIGSFEDVNGVMNTASSSNIDNAVYFDNVAPLKPVVLSPSFTSDATPDVEVSCETGSLVQLNESSLVPNPYPAVPITCPGGGAVTFASVPLVGGGPYAMTAVASDASGNQTLSDVFTAVVDSGSPSVDVVKLTAQNPTTNSLPIFFSVTFSEPVSSSSFSSADISNLGTAGGGVWTILNSGDDQQFTISVNALTSDGTVTPFISQNLVEDLAGNLNVDSTSSSLNTVTYDGTVPLAPIITGPFFTQSANPTLSVNCEANEDLEFTISPYGGVNPVAATCSGGSATVVIPTSLGADGVYSILPTAIDAVNNKTDGNVFNLVLDTGDPAPTITLSTGQGTLVNASPVFFDVAWDEPIDASTFTGVDITNTGSASGGVWSVANSGDSQNFVISVTGLVGDGSIEPAISAGVVNDAALNLNLMGSYAGVPVVLDRLNPDAPVITGPAYTSNASPTLTLSCDSDSASVSVLIPGYAGSPIAAGPCPLGSLSVVLPVALSSEGTFTLTPVAEDAAGNSITGLPFTLLYDSTNPSVAIERLISQPTQTNLLPISFSVSFSESIDPVSFSAADISEINASPAPGGVWSVTNSGDNQNFTISKSGVTGDGFVQPQIGVGLVSDLTGNTNSSVSSVGVNGDSVEYVVTPPGTPTVLSPTFTNTVTPTLSISCEIGSSIQVSISTYSPDPYPATPLNCSSSPLALNINPALAGEGTYTVRAIASDSIGNQSISVPLDVVVDTTSPTVVISQAATQLDPTRLMPIQYDVAFSEPIEPSSFTSADITNIGSSSGSGSWVISNSGDNQNFVISLSGLVADGTVDPRILNGVVSDFAGNLNTASPSPPATDTEVEYDGTPPGIPSILQPRYTNTDTPTVDVNCELGSLVQIQSASISAGAAFPAVAVSCASSPLSITVPVSLVDADYILTALAADAVGNVSTSSTYTMTVDTINPDVTIDRLVGVTADRTNSEPVVFSVAFSEPIDSATFNSASVTDAVGALSPGLWAVTNSGDNQNFTISASSIAGEGNIEPQLLAGAVQDKAGNGNNIYSVLSDGDVYFDNIAPSDSDITSWSWTLSSPSDGSVSVDGTPQINLTGAVSENGAAVQIFDDVSCTSPQGTPQIVAAGAMNITDVSYLTDGSQDGLKIFFVQVTDDVGNVSNCVPTSQSYTLDTTAPSVLVSQALTQADPATDLPVFFEVLFSEKIDPVSFTTSDLTNTGTISNLSMNIINSGDDQKFSIEITSPDTGGTVVMEIAPSSVADLAGNMNTVSPYVDNSINYNCVNPSPITDMYYGPVTQTTVDLFWTPNAQIGCEPVSDYEVEFRIAGIGVWSVFTDGVTSDPLATVTGLIENTNYEFRIRAFNDLFSTYSNIVEVSTKPISPFFDPTDYKLINLTGATDSKVVALEDGTDVYLTTDVNDPSPTLLASLEAGETHQFASVRGEILISNKPIFAAGRIGSYTLSCSGSGNPTWVPPLWSDKVLLFNASRNSPQTIYVFAFEDVNVTVYRNNAVAVPSTFVAENTIAVLTAAGTGSFRVEADGFIAATRHGTSYVDDMPALPKATRIMGYPSNSGLLSTSATASIDATLYHSDGFSLVSSVIPTTFTSMSPRGSSTSLYRAEALFVEAPDLISANNTADSDGCNSAPFNPIHNMMRRYAVNVDAQYVAFASTYPAQIKMITPDGIESEFTLSRTGTGPFALKSPYKFYLSNVEEGTRFEGYTPLDRYSVWYQSDTRDGAGYEDETIIYGYK